MADPKYVKCRAGVTAVADVMGTSRFAITGNDVKPFPEDQAGKSFVRTKIREGALEEADSGLYEEVQKSYESDIEIQPIKVPHQERKLRKESAEKAEKVQKKLDAAAKKNEEEESESDRLQAESEEANKARAAKQEELRKSNR